MPYTENVGFNQGLFGSLLNQAIRPTSPGGPKGLFGLDPATWAQISGSFANAALTGGNVGTAMGGVGTALQNRQVLDQQRRQQEYQQELEDWQRQMQQRQQQFEETQAGIRNRYLEESANIDRRGIALREAEFERGPQSTNRWRTLSAEEAARQGLPAGSVYQLNETTGQLNPVTETRAQTWTQGQRDKSIYVANMTDGFNRAMALVESGRVNPRGIVANRPRWTMSPDERDFYRAMRDVAEAELRIETGAAATQDEINRKLEQLLAGFNEGDSNVASIMGRTRGRIEDMAAATGGAYESLYPQSSLSDIPTRYQAFLNGTSPGSDAPADQARVNLSTARISTDAEFEALPSGAVFVGPDGVRRRKP